MANTLEYIFSLQDKVSAKIGNITVTSEKMLGKFADLEKKTVSVNRTFNETGRTLGSLREKLHSFRLNGNGYRQKISKASGHITGK